MQNQTANNKESTLTQHTVFPNKSKITIHTLMMVLSLMTIFALAFIAGLDYFFNFFELHGRAINLPCGIVTHAQLCTIPS